MKIVLIGYGAMGQNLAKMVETTPHQIVNILGQEINVPLDFTSVGEFDVLIDFSHPNNLDAILDFLQKRKKPGVIATTGMSQKQLDSILLASANIPLLYSQNMSIGISIVKKVIKDINRALEFLYDVEIVESHHKNKLDAPSGTAIMLANALNEDGDYDIISRGHQLHRRQKQELAIHPIRGGGLLGEHSVLFLGEEEYLEVKHVALSRNLFCRGAIRGGEYLLDKQSGLYNIDDVINNS